jgi:O-antigen ligase
VLLVSGLITFFRYADFFPFQSERIRDLVVNVNGVRAQGAMMSTVFSFLNYATGFLFFAVLLHELRSREALKKILVALSASTMLSLLFVQVQKHAVGLGNTPYWTNLGQLNSTFKDPNSFGVFLASSLPVFLGLALFFRGTARYLFFFLIVFSLFIFPSIGSRSPLLGLLASFLVFLVFVLKSAGPGPRRKLVFSAGALAVLALVAVSLFVAFRDTSLSRRLTAALINRPAGGALSDVLAGKLDLWRIASAMIKDYPLTGVGLGSFIVELPNYGRETGSPLFSGYTDSAENYFFQAGSELGLIGLVLFLWLFWEIVLQVRRSGRAGLSGGRDKYILIGTIAGLSGFFVNFLFHSYIGSYEVNYAFWLFAAVAFLFQRQGEPSTPGSRWSRAFKGAAAGAVFIFGLVHLWNSTQSLSLAGRTHKFDWRQDFGFYQAERDDAGFMFQWARKSAGITVENVGSLLVLPILASHPDIGRSPVKVEIYLADRYFRKRSLLKTVVLKETKWEEIEIPFSDFSQKLVRLVIETDREWRPLKYKIQDPRRLAVGIGLPWFRYPGDIPLERIREILTVPSGGWTGGLNEDRWTWGKGELRFSAPARAAALRLWVRGQKAFGIGPYIVLSLDGALIAKTMVNEDEWTPLYIPLALEKGDHVLSVEYLNDFTAAERGQDRNLSLGDLELIYD